jgi:hypothetical protein
VESSIPLFSGYAPTPLTPQIYRILVVLSNRNVSVSAPRTFSPPHPNPPCLLHQVSYCPALSSLVCFCLRIGFLEGETAAIAQAGIDNCSKSLGVLSIGRASHVSFARGLYLAVKQFSSTAFELCSRIRLNFYRLANECNGRIFMHFLSDAALVEVFHAACLFSGGDRAGKAETFLYKFTLALLKFANRRGRLLSSTDNDSFFRNLQDYGRSLVSISDVQVPPSTLRLSQLKPVIFRSYCAKLTASSKRRLPLILTASPPPQRAQHSQHNSRQNLPPHTCCIPQRRQRLAPRRRRAAPAYGRGVAAVHGHDAAANRFSNSFVVLHAHAPSVVIFSARRYRQRCIWPCNCNCKQRRERSRLSHRSRPG